MIRLVVIIIFFLLSLLTLFRAPTNFLWYVSILVTEFSWIFFLILVILLLLKYQNTSYKSAGSIIGIASLVLFTLPIIEAYGTASKIEKIFNGNYQSYGNSKVVAGPYSFLKTLYGFAAKKASYKTITYDTANSLTLDFYTPVVNSRKTCVIVVHGGSWAGGDSQQLPELNSELAKAGYAVATINYRLAPKYKFPAPIEDVRTVLAYLRKQASSLGIDGANFILLGRSAGGQIVITAAYTLNDPGIKGVISFYGPIDMVWGYANPTNPLVLNSRKVMSDYLGGSYNEVPQQYIKSSGTEIATKTAVPTLLIHGENDPLVSHLHGVRLGKKLDSLNVKHFDVYLPWATHGFDWTLNGPGGQTSTWCVMQFLDRLQTH